MGRYLEILDSNTAADDSWTFHHTQTHLRSHIQAPVVQGTATEATIATKALTGVADGPLQEDLQLHVLGMSLEQFARSNLTIQVNIPGCQNPIWWVPNSRVARSLVDRGVGRGCIWTAQELRLVWQGPPLQLEDARTLARIKAQLGCELTALGPDDGGETSC